MDEIQLFSFPLLVSMPENDWDGSESETDDESCDDTEEGCVIDWLKFRIVA